MSSSLLRRFVGVAVAGLVLAGIGLSVWRVGPFGEAERPAYASFPDPAAGVGTEDDPHARLRFEWMRTRDPATGRIPPNARAQEQAFAKTLPVRKSGAGWTARGPNHIGGRTRALGIDASDPSGSTILAGGVSGGMWRTTDGGASWTRTFGPDQRPSVTTLAQDPRPGRTRIWYAGTGEFRGNSARGGRASYRGDGIYRSVDGGRSWRLLRSTQGDPTRTDSPFDFVHRVRVDASNRAQDEVYAATHGGVYRSVDGGASWERVLGGSGAFDPGGARIYSDVAVTPDGVVYAALDHNSQQGGLYRSETGEAGTFARITPGGWPRRTFLRTVLAVDPSDPDVVWVLAHAPDGGPRGDRGRGRPIDHVLWRYDAGTDGVDGPGQWRAFSDHLPRRGDGDVSSVGGLTGDFNSQFGYNLTMAVHPTEPTTLFVGGRNLWRLDVSDAAAPDPAGAAAWIGGYTASNASYAIYQPPGSDRHHPDVHALAFLPGAASGDANGEANGEVLFTGSDGGVHRTANALSGSDGAVTYASLNDGYRTTQFYTVCRNDDPADPTIMGGMQDNGTWLTTSTDAGADWTEQRGGDGSFCAIVNATDGGPAGVETFRYASSQFGRVVQYACADAASGDCPARAAAYPVEAEGVLFVHPFAVDPSDPRVMYYPAGEQMWRTTSLETAPIAFDALPGARVPSGHVITAVEASDGSPSHVLYYGTADGGRLDPGRVFRLDDAATADPSAEAVEVTGAAFPEGGYVSDIAVDPTDADRVLVAFSNYSVPGLFYTNDGGATWTDVSGSLRSAFTAAGGSGPSVRSAAFLPSASPDEPETIYVGTSVGLYSTQSLAGRATTWVREAPNVIGTVVVDQVTTRPADGLVLVGTHANGVFTTRTRTAVDLSGLDVERQGRDAVRVSWTVARAAPGTTFRVERRYRDGAFEPIHEVAADGPGTDGAGTTEYVAAGLAAGPHAFRVRAVGPDGASTLSDVRTVQVRPAGAYALTAPAPNPFVSQTQMRLVVRETQPVTVALYDVLGQRVRTLFDAVVDADVPVDVRVEARGLSSGPYFARVTGDAFAATRKVVLVR